jgi:hypothetical protein
MSLVEEETNGGYRSSKKTTIDFMTGKTEKTLSIIDVD